LVIAGLSLPVAALAQSPFNLFNLGGSVEAHDARIEGRGGWGMAEVDSLVPAFKNLAGLADINSVVVMLSGYGETRLCDYATDFGVAQRRTRRVFTPNLRGAIPLLGRFGALTAGFRARRATQFSVSQTDLDLYLESDSLTVFYDEFFLREGTQFEIPIGIAMRLHRSLAVGASVNLIRGGITETITDFFTTDQDNNGSYDYLPSTQVEAEQFNGTSATFSLLLSPWSRLHLGAAYTPAHEVEVERTLTLDGVAQPAESQYTLSLPQEWSVGAAFQLAGRWRLGADFEFQEFSQLAVSPGSGREDWRDGQDEWTLACGVERQGVRVRRGGWNNLPIRFGVMLRHWGYQMAKPVWGDEPAAGQPINETRISVGTGFPFRYLGGQLDVALGYGWLGDLQKHGVEDRIWRLTISITGLEKWW